MREELLKLGIRVRKQVDNPEAHAREATPGVSAVVDLPPKARRETWACDFRNAS
jgi:hypothetical protein